MQGVDSMEYIGLQHPLLQNYMDLFNDNQQEIFFQMGFLIQTDANGGKYQFIENPTYYETEITNYVPVTIVFSDKAHNVEGTDASNWDLVISFLLSGNDESSETLIRQKNAIEEARMFLSNNPLDTIEALDTQYQIYNDTNDTGVFDFEWEADTEYTILANVEEYTHSLGYTVVDGTSINALAVNIPPATIGVFKQKFTTGSIPLEEHKQFITNGSLGDIQIRTALLKGDFTGLDDETIKNVVEAKDKSGLYENLLDNKFNFTRWSTQDFETKYTTIEYDLVQSVSHTSLENAVAIVGGKTLIPISMNIALESGIEVGYGNDWVVNMSLKGGTLESIKPLTFNPIKGKNVESNTDLTATNPNAESLARDGIPSIHMSFYYNRNSTVQNEILKELVSLSTETTVNKEYTITFTNGVISGSKTVILTGGNEPNTRGQKSIMNVQFMDT